MMTSNIIQALWIGDRLSVMERLSIRSFLDQGHEFHLYLYGRCDGVPHGTTIRNGREILDGGVIHSFQGGYGKGSPALFSDLFRLELLFQRGGWWVDLDVVALQPFRFDRQHVLGAARGTKGRTRIQAGIIHAPSESPLVARCLETLRNLDLTRARWGETGPRLLARTATELGMGKDQEPPPVFYPIDAADFWRFLRPAQPMPDAIGLHLWAQLWRHYGLNPDGRYPETSIYEQLIARYLPEAGAEARHRVNVTAAILRSVPRRISTGAWFWSRRLRQRFRRA
jgi:hypothetical protein